MHEKDSLDRMLESSLSSYGDPGTDSGIAERILACVSSEHKAYKPAPRWRNRFVLWAALPAAACLLLTLFTWKPAGRPAIRPSTHPPNVAAVAPKSQVPLIPTPRQTMPTRVVYPMPARPSAAAAGSVARPKLDVFPRPQPLSAEEEALYAFATQVPEQQRQAVLTAQKNDDAPLDIAAIHIQPLEISDTGKN